MTPRSSASANPIDGRLGSNSSFSISPQMRSAGRSSSGNVAADRLRAGSIVERESRRELHAAEDAQAVVTEGARVDGSQQLALEVGPAVEGIEVLAGERIPRDRVDR